MDSFRSFLEQQEFVEAVLAEFNDASTSTPSIAAVQPAQPGQKIWSAKKKEIIQMWQNVRADTPIIIQPMTDTPIGGEQSTYGEDGIRITGSWYFISSVLARLKEILAYENAQTKLRLVFRGTDKDRSSRADRQSFVFYLNLEKRAHGKAGRPKTNPNMTTQLPGSTA